MAKSKIEFKVIRVTPDVHKFLKTMTANNGFSNINECLEFIIDNTKKPCKSPVQTRHAGEPL
jgi:hypothetical protein